MSQNGTSASRIFYLRHKNSTLSRYQYKKKYFNSRNLSATKIFEYIQMMKNHTMIKQKGQFINFFVFVVEIIKFRNSNFANY